MESNSNNLSLYRSNAFSKWISRIGDHDSQFNHHIVVLREYEIKNRYKSNQMHNDFTRCVYWSLIWHIFPLCKCYLPLVLLNLFLHFAKCVTINTYFSICVHFNHQELYKLLPNQPFQTENNILICKRNIHFLFGFSLQLFN